MAVISALGGGKVVWHSDTKPASIALLAHRYPDIPNLGDVTTIDWSSVPPTDLLAASWPCQPHSAAGKRLGEKDPRALWPHIAAAVQATRPAVVFGENVARITSNGELRRVIRSLAELGYLGAWWCVRASDVGACHRRDRCFVVAIDRAAAHAVGLELRDQPGRGGRSSREGARVTGHDGPKGEVQLALLPTPSEKLGGNRGSPSRRTAQERLDSGRRNLDDAVMALLPTPAVADARNTRNATAGRSPGQEHHHSGWTLSDIAQANRWGIYAAAIARHEIVLGRPVPDPTQISPRTGNPQLAPKFVEWMMVLPEGWVTDVPRLTRNQQLSLLGDGVVPAQGAAAFEFLLDHLVQRVRSGEAA